MLRQRGPQLKSQLQRKPLPSRLHRVHVPKGFALCRQAILVAQDHSSCQNHLDNYSPRLDGAQFVKFDSTFQFACLNDRSQPTVLRVDSIFKKCTNFSLFAVQLTSSIDDPGHIPDRSLTCTIQSKISNPVSIRI